MGDDYSVSELAHLVASAATFPRPASADDIDLVIRRLRSWTVAGALLPIDDPYSGRGNHRCYDRTGLYSAAVLNALAIGDQSIGTLISVGRLIRNLAGPTPLLAGKIVQRWEQAIAGTAEIFLIRCAGLRLRRGDANPDRDAGAVEGLILSGELLDGVRGYSSVVVVLNLTTLFARLP